MKNTSSTYLRVGIFVTTALIIGAAMAFMIGDRKGVFRRTTRYDAVFHDVAGLRPGSTLRIAGVDVGTVGKVKLLGDGSIHVELNVGNDYTALVRDDSVATVGSKGLLGDKLVDITVGHGSQLREGARVKTSEPMDLSALTSKAGEIMESARVTVNNLRSASGLLADDGFKRDVQDAVHNVSETLRLANSGNGVVHRLLDDPEMATRIDQTLANAQATTRNAAAITADVHALTQEVRHGDGSAHELIYGESGTVLVRNLASTAGEASQMLSSIRTGNGTLHDLIYTDRAGAMVDNANAMSGDLRAIVADIRAGRGTIGGLITDPSIYEDVKRLVGNLERNEILRAMVRYSIRHDEQRGAATVRETE